MNRLFLTTRFHWFMSVPLIEGQKVIRGRTPDHGGGSQTCKPHSRAEAIRGSGHALRRKARRTSPAAHKGILRCECQCVKGAAAPLFLPGHLVRVTRLPVWLWVGAVRCAVNHSLATAVHALHLFLFQPTCTTAPVSVAVSESIYPAGRPAGKATSTSGRGEAITPSQAGRDQQQSSGG